MLKSMGNPQQFIQNMMGNSQIMSNDMVKNAYGMVEDGSMTITAMLTADLHLKVVEPTAEVMKNHPIIT